MVLKKFAFFLCICLIAITGCRQGKEPAGASTAKIQVVTTLFPLYDMSRAIAGNRADVRLLVPPGVEPHNFEPRPDDIMTINRASLFIYTNRYMEPWAEKLSRVGESGRVKVIDASSGIDLQPASQDFHDDHGHKSAEGGHKAGAGMDPHAWLDLENAVKMVNTILGGFVDSDPANRTFYEANAAAYRKRLNDLDSNYRSTLGKCANRKLMHAGHYAFGYLARRYGIDYFAVTGVTADSEPTPARMAELVKQIRALGIKTIFTEELVSPKLAETISGETGAEIVKLHAGHNISRDELSRGVTFPDLMERNLAALSKGLECRQ